MFLKQGVIAFGVALITVGCVHSDNDTNHRAEFFDAGDLDEKKLTETSEGSLTGIWLAYETADQQITSDFGYSSASKTVTRKYFSAVEHQGEWVAADCYGETRFSISGTQLLEPASDDNYSSEFAVLDQSEIIGETESVVVESFEDYSITYTLTRSIRMVKVANDAASPVGSVELKGNIKGQDISRTQILACLHEVEDQRLSQSDESVWLSKRRVIANLVKGDVIDIIENSNESETYHLMLDGNEYYPDVSSSDIITLHTYSDWIWFDITSSRDGFYVEGRLLLNH